MDIFHKVTDETTLLITRSDSDSPLIRCTFDYKTMWLNLFESAGSHKTYQSTETISQEVKAFVRFLDQHKLLPEIDVNTAQSILTSFSSKMPLEGKYEVMMMDTYLRPRSLLTPMEITMIHTVNAGHLQMPMRMHVHLSSIWSTTFNLVYAGDCQTSKSKANLG